MNFEANPGLREMHRNLLSAVVALALSAIGAALASAQTKPDVVVTIAPIHSLVASVMGDVATPALLMPGGSSPHAFALKPSQARSLRQADIIVRVGPGLETFLERPLAALGGDATIVTLDDVDGVRLIDMREGGAWEAHEHGDHHDHDHAEKDHGDHQHEDHDETKHGDGHGDGHGAHNPHIWLDPRNAIVIAQHIAGVLGKADPANADKYQANAEQLRTQLQQLDRDLAAQTASIRKKPYVVFHDAYAYFEDRYQLSPAGAITVSPDRTPGAKRLGDIRGKITGAKAACVFSEPQFEPKLVATVIDGTPARSAVLDPLGAALTPGPELYGALMRELSRSLVACLAQT